MPIDNELYNARTDIWWDEDQILSLLRISINPGRFDYMRSILVAKLGIDPRAKRTLDIGCGGGLLAEEFAHLGCEVTGVDPSEPSLETARAHARQSALDIDYRHASGESLPFADASFDIVYCCDVLEHVTDPDQVVAEAARVLRPGGVFLYDTINRTPLSKLVMIKLMQDWDWSSLAPANLHDWSMFIKPSELEERLRRHGLQPRGITGLKPGPNPLALIRLVRKRKTGKMTLRQLGEATTFVESGDTSILYAGYAIKAAGLHITSSF